MTKEDLRTGEIVTLRRGTHYRVFLGGHCSCTKRDVAAKLDGRGWIDFNEYHDDLTSKVSSDNDIMKVEIGTYTSEFTEFHYDGICKKTIWERPTYYNGKVVCIDNYCNSSIHTIGKIYEFKDGNMTADNGRKYPEVKPVKSFEEWSKLTGSKFIEVVE